MIFHSDQTIYFHPGKTAGTAVEAAFGYTNQTHDPIEKNMEVFKGWDADNQIYLQHATADFMKENMDSDIWNSYFKFVTVRNPFDRLISAYHFSFRGFKKRFGSFSDFIFALPDALTAEPYPSGSHYLPQVEYAFIDGKKVVDYFVRFENIEDDLREVEEYVGRFLPLSLVNTATGKERPALPARTIYTKAMIEIVQVLYKDDIEAFGYPPDPLAAL